MILLFWPAAQQDLLVCFAKKNTSNVRVGADLSNLVNLAAIKATMKDKLKVDMDTLEQAKDDILMGIALEHCKWSHSGLH